MTILYLSDRIFNCGENMGKRYIERKQKKTPYTLATQAYKEKKYGEFIKKASKYLERMPSDVEMRFMRAKSYRKLDCFDEAIFDLKYILNHSLNQHALTELYYLYYYLNMYEEAIDLLPLIYKTKCINSYSVAISELVMKKQLGCATKPKEGYKCDYIMSQVYDYKPELALQLLSNYTIEGNKDKSCFNNNINIDSLFNIVRENIKNSKKANVDEILEVHYFAIQNVGVYNDFICNFIKVVVVPGTDNIVTMYPAPTVDVKYLSNLYCEYDKILKKNQSSRQKQISQIDKFNKKYNRV